MIGKAHGISRKRKRSLCVGSAKRIDLDEPPHLEAHFFALDVVVLVIASKHSDQFEPLTAIEIYLHDCVSRMSIRQSLSCVFCLAKVINSLPMPRLLDFSSTQSSVTRMRFAHFSG